MSPTCPATYRRRGFSMIEIMIAVVIIGLLLTIAVPGFNRARTRSTATRIVNDFRVFSGAFEAHAIDAGDWAEDGNGNQLPAGIAPYLETTNWDQPPAVGEYWDWEKNRFGYTAAVALKTDPDLGVFILVDQKLDDGNLGTGNFVRVSDRYLYILEQ